MQKPGLVNLRFGRYWLSSPIRIGIFILYTGLRIMVATFPIFFAHFIRTFEDQHWTPELTLKSLMFLLGFSFAYMFAHWLYQLVVSAQTHRYIYRRTLTELMLWTRQKQGFFSLHQEGDLIARLTGDVQTIFFNYLIWTAFVCGDILFGSIYIGYLFYRIGWIAALPIGLMLLMVLIQWLLVRRQTAAQKKLRQAQSEWTQCLLEQTEGFHTLRAFGLEQQRLAAISPIQEAVLKAQDDLARCQAGPNTLRNLMSSILVVSLTGLALFLPSADPSIWIEVILLSTGNLWVFMMADSIFGEYRALKVAYGRLEPLALAARKALKNGLEGTEKRLTALEIDHLEFQYPSEATEAGKPDQAASQETERTEPNWKLKLSNLSLKPGQLILVTGPSGGGKTTLLDVLSGEWPQPPSNLTYLDENGQPLPVHQIDGQLARVHQNALIPSGTIRQNLLEADPQASDTALLDALTQAGFEPSELQSGLDTVIGERGITLSGGQRQRLQFAQVCLQKTRLVLLDDLVSAVDRQTEQILTDTLQTLRSQKGLLLVSHRLRIGPMADEILVMEAGSVIERGTHQALMQQKGWYAQEYQRQHEGGADD